MKRPISLSQRGFALTEMLILLGLLGVIALAGGRLFESSIRLTRASAEAANLAASFGSMTQSLRRDAWSAEEFTATDSGARLRSGGATINWTVSKGTVSRDDGRLTRHWPIGAVAGLAVDGPALVLRLSTGNSQGGEIRFISQMQLLSGSAR